MLEVSPFERQKIPRVCWVKRECLFHPDPAARQPQHLVASEADSPKVANPIGMDSPEAGLDEGSIWCKQGLIASLSGFFGQACDFGNVDFIEPAGLDLIHARIRTVGPSNTEMALPRLKNQVQKIAFWSSER